MPVVAMAQPPQAAPPGEVSPELEAYQGRPVRRIEFRVPSDSSVKPVGALSEQDEKLARNQLRQSESVPFDARVVSEDISRLNRLGRFRRVEATVQMLADGSVDLTYDVTLQPMVTAVQTVGNRQFEDDELIGGLRLEGTPVDPTLLERLCRRMEDQYKAKGYFSALVTIDENELEESGIVVFNIREGQRTKIAEVRFEGVRSFSPRQLKKPLKTRESWLIDVIRDGGRLDNDAMDEDVGTIIGFYKDRGYLDVRADRTVTPSPDGREAVVTFMVDEGQVYTLRDLKLKIDEGEEPVIALEQLEGLLRLKAGDVYSEAEVRNSIKGIEGAYGVLGYADARVERQLLREPGRPLVDLQLVVRQGRRYRTGVVEIRGNTSTDSGVIREQITLLPERPLDPLEIEESRKRLERLRLFTPRSVKSSIQPEREDDPEHRDVLFEVEETSTRSFNVGAAVSSDASVTARISVTQRNFKLTDWPDSWSELWTGEAFYGGGQTFTIEALPGDRVRIFSVSLLDPYAWGTDYSVSTSAYFRDRLYSAYTEQRIGAKLAVGRKFGSRWSVNVPLTAEKIELHDIDDDAPTDYFEVEDGDSLLSAGLRLSRSAVDDISFPSKGSSIDLGVTQYFGDFEFTRLSAEYQRFFKIDEDALGLKTVLFFNTHTSYIPQGQDDVPFYERLYLGGSSFRGFGYRAVAPVGVRQDNGEVSEDTIGGVFSFFAGLELRRPLFTELVSGVLFIDTGTVDDSFSFSEYRVSVGFGFRVYVEQLSAAPLAFDFGFPILSEDTDDTRFFTFNIDVPFR
ncbi:Outer membrane protein assembly factor BamA [Phycisphaerales bacterium]|nr:Outer membrane protein assembly factor BamA [Phycisphaerales bacterium]